MGSEVRLGQLIAPFGPGSIYTDKNGVPTVVCGLDYWFTRDVNGCPQVSDEAKEKSDIFEPRLSELLKITCFRRPPEFYYDSNNPEMSKLMVQGHRLPRWYVNNNSGRLKRFNLETQKLDKPETGSWRPVRFIAVCESGHMSDFPWKEWIDCTCNDNNGLMLNDSGGADLSSINVKCTQCKRSRSLAGATLIRREEGAITSSGLSDKGILCSGQRPWLGERADEPGCKSHLSGVLINQSNIYFANTASSIFLPELNCNEEHLKIQSIFSQSDSEVNQAKVMFSLGYKEGGINILKKEIEKHWDDGATLPDDETIHDAYKKYGNGEPDTGTAAIPDIADTALLSFRRQEFNILRNEIPQGKSPELRILSSIVPDCLQSIFERVNLVERLRETRVFYGFDRLVKDPDPLLGMPDKALNQLFARPPGTEASWLPAVKNYGEGIYLELSESAIAAWLDKNADWLQRRYTPDFVSRMINEPLLLPPDNNVNWRWAAKYQLVHTLSHILINQLVFECGYSSAALKERLFVSNDAAAPMAGILIYTASGDSEGSLGGLVRLGRPEMFENLVKRAVSRASWCSADPVCSENLGGTGSKQVNLAACHACVLLPETACETINNGLDRATLVGTPEFQQGGFLTDLLQWDDSLPSS
ncbi:DUF1998 domain-containing protein [Alteromonas macleodii]|uniref:DUF1998 domain-containing protein n=1 Tax=Alteromonas macleodii TaxID=28108 RepID=UPI00313C0BD3